MRSPVPRFPPTRLIGAFAAAAALAGCGHLPIPAPAPPPTSPAPDDNAVPAGAARTLKLRFPALRPIAHASGRLQVDDADDLVVALAPSGQSNAVVVALLVSGGPQDYRVVASSQVIADDCPACSTTVAIARHVLSVQITHPADPDADRTTYQFAYRDNGDALRLVGVNTAQAAQPDDPISHAYASSANLLTGARVETLEMAPNDAARRRELRTTLPLRPPIAFESFSFGPTALAAETRRTPASSFEPVEPLPAAADSLLQARFPGLKIQSRAIGALRADGPRDVAVVLAPTTGQSSPGIIAVLLGQPDGSMKLGPVSGPVTRDCAGCDVLLEIARRTLVVQIRGSDALGTQTRGYQFALVGKAATAATLRLIGVRTVSVTRPASGDVHRSITTANLLTGDRLDVTEDLVRGSRQRAQHASHVALRPAVALAGFGFEPDALAAETRRDVTQR